MRSLALPAPPHARAGESTRWRPIADALRDLLRSGRVAPGELFASTRELARTFGVHRHTVQVAFDALIAEGLVVAEPRRGYRAAAPPPDLARLEAEPARAAPYAFRIHAPRASLPQLPPKITYPLHAATPDPRLVPIDEIRASYAHVLEARGGSLLDGIDERGSARLRDELAKYLRRARAVDATRSLLTAGSQEAIALAARVLLGPGDVVAVEDPGYVPAWDAFRAAGAEIAPVAVDESGLRVDALEQIVRRRRVRLVYVTPTHHYPTTVTMSAFRRRALLSLTLARGIPILEDDYDHEYHFRAAPQPPLAASPDGPHVAYVATLSKLVAPGLRVGVIVAGEDLLEAMAAHRRLGARSGDGVTQAALADWIASGGFERHVRRARRTYAERRDLALAAIERSTRDLAVEIGATDGGLSIWTRWPEHDATELARRALARGVSVLPEALARHGAAEVTHGVRLAFGRSTPRAFASAIAILAAEARRMR